MERILEFLEEIDKLKNVSRDANNLFNERKENSAENSWIVIMIAIVLKDYANEKIDLLRVLKMLAIHDLGEIDTGDISHYAENINKHENEKRAILRILESLPERTRSEFLNLWEEFEANETIDSNFANSIDRFVSVSASLNQNGACWNNKNMTADFIRTKNQHIKLGSEKLWNFVLEKIEEFDRLELIGKEKFNH